MSDAPQKMNDDDEAVNLIVNAPEITAGEMERAQKKASEAPVESGPVQGPVHEGPAPVDKELAELGGKAIEEALTGFGVPMTDTTTELSGTLFADVAATVPQGSSRVGRICATVVLLGLCITPPLLRVFGVLERSDAQEAPVDG